MYSSAHLNVNALLVQYSAVLSQKAGSAYFTIKLPFGFAVLFPELQNIHVDRNISSPSG